MLIDQDDADVLSLRGKRIERGFDRGRLCLVIDD